MLLPECSGGVPLPGRVAGMLLGLAIGDALGNPTEGMEPEARVACAWAGW